MMRLAFSSLLLVVAAAVNAQESTPTAPTSAPVIPSEPGKPYFWFGLWPDYIVKYDPVIDQVVAKVKFKNGLAFGDRLSHDKSKYIVITGQRRIVEVIDRKTMTVVDEHRFAEQGFIIRVDRVMEVPGGKYWYVNISKVKLDVDKYVVERPEWLYYDIAAKKIEKRLKDLPRAIRNGARISPDGKKWHVFGRDLVIVDPETLEEDGRIELSKPLYDGLGAIRVRGDDFLDGADANAYRMIYTMNDPVLSRRTLIGMVDIDIAEKKVTKLEEWGADPGTWGFDVSFDKKRAVAMLGGGRGGGDTGDERMRIGLFDLEMKGRKLGETEIKVRPRRMLAGISPDGRKIYVGGAGNDFEIYDDGFKYLKTVTFDGDLHGGIDVLVDP